MRDHTKLRAFELADDVAVFIYKVTKDFPKEEIYGLTSQMRRAAVSVPSNIVEGCARESQAEYLRFLETAMTTKKLINITKKIKAAWVQTDWYCLMDVACGHKPTINKKSHEFAFGSLRELHYQFGLSIRLDYVKEPVARECNLKLEESEKVLGALMRSIRNS